MLDSSYPYGILPLHWRYALPLDPKKADLKAAPGAFLDLSPSTTVRPSAPTAPLPVLSKNTVKKLQALVRKHLEESRQTRTTVAPDPAPRYDEVFAKGQEWLDDQTGEWAGFSRASSQPVVP